MPYRLLIVVLLGLARMPVDAATLKGVILANETSGSPIENVGVDAISGTNLTISDIAGKFTLEFPQRQIGDTVRIVVKKEGYVVVNDVQLETVLPADADAAPLAVILAKEGDREEMARRFYRLKSFDAIEETYQRKLSELEDEHRADAAALVQLQQERDQAKASAEKASEELAKDRPGQASELYKEAKRLFLAGKIDEAIKLLDDEELRQLVAQSKKAIDDAVQAWLLKAQLLTVQFRFEDAKKAYKAAIDAAPDSYQAKFAYAVFNQNLNRFEQARADYGRCLEWARENGQDAELSATLNNLGNIDSAQNREEEAHKEYAEALQTYRELAKKNSDTYRPFVALTLINLGGLDRAQDRTEEARKEIEEALQTYRDLAQKNPDTYRPFVALTLMNLGALDGDQGQLEEARKEFQEVLQTYRELAQENPDTYRPYLALTLNNLGLLDYAQSRLEEARKEFEEALQAYRELAQKNPETYRPDVALTLFNNVALLDRAQGRLDKARKEYEEALQTYHELAQKKPETYRRYLAAALNKLGDFNWTKDRMEEARKEYAEALQTYRELAQKNPEIYRRYLAYTLKNLGDFDYDEHRIKEARKEYVEALQIYEALAEQYPEKFSPDVSRVKKLLEEVLR